VRPDRCSNAQWLPEGIHSLLVDQPVSGGSTGSTRLPKERCRIDVYTGTSRSRCGYQPWLNSSPPRSDFQGRPMLSSRSLRVPDFSFVRSPANRYQVWKPFRPNWPFACLENRARSTEVKSGSASDRSNRIKLSKIHEPPCSHGVSAPPAHCPGEATNTGFASPGCAALSGFLNLSALCSSPGRPGLVSCR
jgi:hypothetical protein